MPWRRSVPHLAGVLVAVLIVLASPFGTPSSPLLLPWAHAASAVAAARAAVTYLPPVDAPVIDEFRPPATRYGRGNRGIDYDTDAGQPVHAAADGTVVFAGRVGLARHVVLLHADSLRTTYAFLATVDVARGDRVARGDVVGTAGERLHLGVRAGTAYLDPLELFGQRPRRGARLVADPGVEAERPPARGASAYRRALAV